MGALGMMQLMLPPAEQMNVGDILAAGTKHPRRRKNLRYVEDIYFDAKSLAFGGEGALLLRCAHNAGPNRIESLRREVGQTRAGPKPLVQERGVRGGGEDRAGRRSAYVANIFRVLRRRPAGRRGQQERQDAREKMERGEALGFPHTPEEQPNQALAPKCLRSSPNAKKGMEGDEHHDGTGHRLVSGPRADAEECLKHLLVVEQPLSTIVSSRSRPRLAARRPGTCEALAKWSGPTRFPLTQVERPRRSARTPFPE